MSIIYLTDSNFEKEVIKSSLPVLIDFWAPWCMPCKMINPILEELEKEYGGKVKIGKVNVDECQEKASEYRVMSIPNLKFFKDGKLVDELIGVVPKKMITEKLDALLSPNF